MTFNVKDYGAVGDGVTDDRAAIQSALNAAAAATQAPPSAPSLTQQAGGSFANGSVVNVVATYLTGRGETAVSASSQLTISALNNEIVVQLPTFPTGVYGMNVYASSASGGTTLYRMSSGNGPTSTTSGGTVTIANFASISNVLAPTQDTTGGGLVYFPVGAYYVSTTTNPTDSTYSGALFVYSNTMLQGDGPHESIIKLASSAANQAAVIQNAHISAAGGAHDTNIVICDLCINGNSDAVNQTNTVDRNRGIWLNSCRDVRIFNVVSKNCLGLTGGSNGPHGTTGEGHHIVVYASTDVLIENCIVFSDDGGPTASGIGVGDCEATRVIGCVAHDMQIGLGITTYDCSGLSIIGCNVYKCNSGIFVEIGTDVSLDSCTVGGTTPFNNSFYYPLPKNTLIGCTGNAGIASRGTINLRVTNCHSVGNQYGIVLQNEVSPARNQANTVVTGCRFSNSADVGVWCNNVNDAVFVGCYAENNGSSGFFVDTISSGLVVFDQCVSRNNTNYGYECHGSTSQWVLIRDCQASGNSVNDVIENGSGYKIHGNLTAPSIGSSPFTYTNVFATPVRVYVNGGSVSSIAITPAGGSSTATGATSGAFDLKPGDAITLTYSTKPSWTWWAL